MDDRTCENYSINNIINIVCLKKAKAVWEKTDWCKRTTNEDVYAELVDSYISETPWGGRLKEEIIFYATREDDNVKELLEKIQKLEETNAKLRERNNELTAENGNLTEEKDRYLYEILEIRRSATYKLGRAITFIPRKLRGKK